MRTPPPELFVCSVDNIALTSAFPAVWISDVDATNAAAGIHCGPVRSGAERLALTVAKRLLRVVE